jgi:predicted ester cyclase
MGDTYRFYNPLAAIPINADEHLGMMQMMSSAFDAGHEFHLLVAEENNVVVSGTWQGKHVGDFNGVPATGKTIELRFIDIFTFAGDRVVDHHIEFNPAPLMSLLSAQPSYA